jgi:hypothetical protein
MRRSGYIWLVAILACVAGAARMHARAGQAGTDQSAAARTGEQIYRAACATCHGPDGKGALRSAVGFDVPFPDFTDCRFAPREADFEWFAVAHEGGPVRAFNRKMPSFGEALSEAEIVRTLDYIRGFCTDRAWPRGDLNLPRAIVTEKAFPEDEAVITTGVATSGSGSVTNELVYERRFGARNQFEVKVPIDSVETDGGAWAGGVGDIALGVKSALAHSRRKGSILSAGGEVVFPTGNADKGLGSGVTKVEPFVAFGQILPSEAFLHLQGGAELSTDTGRANHEAFWRAALGRSFRQGRFGRMWSPMVEILGARELASGEHAEWDLLPQVQVTLSTRQHIMANVGVRFPVNRRQGRDTTLLFYFLWDWFDGGLFQGW